MSMLGVRREEWKSTAAPCERRLKAGQGMMDFNVPFHVGIDRKTRSFRSITRRHCLSFTKSTKDSVLFN
jgi:hypothetical protein